MNIKIVILILFVSLQSTAQQSDANMVKWIEDHCDPISLSAPDSDLSFLSTLQPANKILSIGEVSHGIGEFASIKFRIFKYLAANYGYRLFTIEDGFFKVEPLNKYLLSGEGNPERILATLIRSYANEETLEMIKWMRSYNANLTDPSHMLKIYGFDCQRTELILNRLKQIYQDDHEINSLLDTVALRQWRPYSLPTVSKATLLEIRRRIALTSRFNEIPDQGLSVRQLLKMLNYSHELAEGHRLRRDEYMTELLSWIVKSEGDSSKAVVSAHNTHVCYSPITNRAGDSLNANMGSHLKKRFGDRVFTIGIDFNKGSFWAADISGGEKKTQVFTLPDAPVNTFSFAFSQAGKEAFYLDLAKVKNETWAYEWFAVKRGYRYITAVFNDGISNEGAMAHTNLLGKYDALIFFNAVSEASLLNR